MTQTLMSVEKECISVSRCAKTRLAHIHVIAMTGLCSALMEDLAMVNYSIILKS